MQKHTGSYLLLAAALCLSQAQGAVAKMSYPHLAPLAQYLSKSVPDEIALARSAAPAAVSGHAQILTLGRHGYEIAARGTNGFVCLVERSWELNFDDAKFWDPGIRTPMCFNAAAAHSVLREFLMRTDWVLAGLSTAQMAARSKGVPPLKGSMAYMMSRRQLICANGACNHWYPHLMFFFPSGEAPNWGANQNGVPVLSGRFSSLTAVYFVLVPTWSDGTPSVGGGTQ
ncbi:MAG TPA: hypothetical protein VHY36_15020 [Steroidobacteraceae bacterium]|jgi:hypothetical protein|nr:hypothetical protein [Steroidobacteraceae bacterium]